MAYLVQAAQVYDAPPRAFRTIEQCYRQNQPNRCQATRLKGAIKRAVFADR